LFRATKEPTPRRVMARDYSWPSSNFICSAPFGDCVRLIIINSQRPFNHVTANGKINVGETNESLWGPQLILWVKLRHITEEMRAFAKQTVEIKNYV
jgi:hypothetical protein